MQSLAQYLERHGYDEDNYEAEPVDRRGDDERYHVFLLPLPIVLLQVHEKHVKRPIQDCEDGDYDELDGFDDNHVR